MKICTIENCSSPILARGWCRKHYLTWRRNGDPLKKVDRAARMVRGADHPGFRHGLWNHPLYPVWHSMMARCYNPANKRHKRYGQRGIAVCESWHDVRNFVRDMAPRPEGMTLDRVDNDAGYSPANCRWVDRLTQARNRAQAILTDAQRNEIVTRYLDGQTPKNIAGTMGVRVSQVKNTAYGHLRREKIKGVAK
jgi:hypothetical protein